MSAEPTKKQIESLRWLIERYGTENIPSNALMHLYEQRARAAHAVEGERWAFHAATPKQHGWRRTSGRVLMEMQRRGLLAFASFGRHGQINYCLTPAGREVAK